MLSPVKPTLSRSSTHELQWSLNRTLGRAISAPRVQKVTRAAGRPALSVVGLKSFGQRGDGRAAERRPRHASDLERMFRSQGRYRLMIGVELPHAVPRIESLMSAKMQMRASSQLRASNHT